jgi:ABC-type multidrug transport system ATPase subunit
MLAADTKSPLWNHRMSTITLGSAADNTCRIRDASVAPHHAEAVPLSGSEYLLRNLSGGHDGLVVARQPVSLARIDKFTPLRIGQIKTSLDELLKRKTLEPQANPLERYNQTYSLDEGKRYLAGASPVCEILLPSPRLPWHCLEIIPRARDWQVTALHGRRLWLFRRRWVFQPGQVLRAGPYRLDFGEQAELRVSVASSEYLSLRNLYTHVPGKSYLHTLHDVSLAIKTGAFVGIVGPSGAGKSTLLKAIRGLIPLHSGQLTLAGRELSPETRSEIGLVPQDDVVIGELTVAENLAFAARLRLPADWPQQAREDKVDELLDAMLLQRQRDQRCTQISGGQRKRVNLALELMLEPAFLLADEACSGLSARDSDNILQHLRGLANRGKGVLLTIHSPDIEALDLMDRLLVLDTGGYVAYYGPPLEAMPYFSRSQAQKACLSPKLIFDVLEKRKSEPDSDERQTSPAEQAAHFKESPYYKRYVAHVLEQEQNADAAD